MLTTLPAQVAAGAPARQSDTGASNLAWARRAAAVPVLGREDSLAALASVWRNTLRGDQRMAVVLGESGIGKTALAAELALQAHAEGGLVLYGRWDREQFSPHQALREAPATYASRCSTAQLRCDLEGDQAQIQRLLPEVAARLGHRALVAGGDCEGERLTLYEAVEAWLGRLAAQRPVLLILDDLHWAERSSVVLAVRWCREALERVARGDAALEAEVLTELGLVQVEQGEAGGEATLFDGAVRAHRVGRIDLAARAALALAELARSRPQHRADTKTS